MEKISVWLRIILAGGLFALVAPIIFGCGKDSPKGPAQDPKASFEMEVKRLAPLLEQAVNSADRTEKCKMVCTKEMISYDIKKTDSLVSPYIATIKVQGVLKSNSAGVGFGEPDGEGYRVLESGSATASFALQDGKWTYKGVEADQQSVSAGPGASAALSIKLAVQAVFEGKK